MEGTLRIALIVLAATVPAALIQELSRAAAALLLTRGRVCVLLGEGRALFALRLGRLMLAVTPRWWWGGECLHAPDASHRRASLIRIAGPLAGDLCFLAAGTGALAWRGGPEHHATAQLALWVFALVALARASVDLVTVRRGRPDRIAIATR